MNRPEDVTQPVVDHDRPEEADIAAVGQGAPHPPGVDTSGAVMTSLDNILVRERLPPLRRRPTVCASRQKGQRW